LRENFLIIALRNNLHYLFKAAMKLFLLSFPLCSFQRTLETRPSESSPTGRWWTTLCPMRGFPVNQAVRP